MPDLQVTRSALKSILGVTSGEIFGDTQTITLLNKTMDVGYSYGGNPAGNVLKGHSGIDNQFLGNPTSANIKRTGSWLGITNVASNGILNTGTTSVGSSANTFSAGEGMGQTYSTGAVADANAGLRWSSERFRCEWGNHMMARVSFSSTSDIRVFIGWSSDAAEIAGETTLNNFSGVGVGKRAGDTNWFTYRNDGDATEDRVDTGIAFSTSTVTIELFLDSTQFKSRIGGVEQTIQTTEIPAGTENLALHLEIETGAGAADKSISIFGIQARVGT